MLGRNKARCCSKSSWGSFELGTESPHPSSSQLLAAKGISRLPRAQGHKIKELSPPGLSASTRISSCGQDALGLVAFRNILSLDLQLQGGRQSTSSRCPNPCPVLGMSLPSGWRVFYRAEAWKSKFGGERLGWKLLAPAPCLPLSWIKPCFRQLLSAPSPPCN